MTSFVGTNGGRGALIVFEGCDRCGKTTQTERLVKWLNTKGSQAELLKFPDRTTGIGKVIDSYLKSGTELSDEAIHLLFSANRWEANERIKKSLNSGKTLIVDRYAYSGVAFTAAKGLDIDWCKQPDVGLPLPDVVFYLDLPTSCATERGGFGNERYEKQSFQETVKDMFFRLKDRNWTIIDAKQSIDDVERQIRHLTEEVIRQSSDKPLGELWRSGEVAPSKQIISNGDSSGNSLKINGWTAVNNRGSEIENKVSFIKKINSEYIESSDKKPILQVIYGCFTLFSFSIKFSALTKLTLYETKILIKDYVFSTFLHLCALIYFCRFFKNHNKKINKNMPDKILILKHL